MIDIPSKKKLYTITNAMQASGEVFADFALITSSLRFPQATTPAYSEDYARITVTDYGDSERIPFFAHPAAPLRRGLR
jgi:hypothetical protein